MSDALFCDPISGVCEIPGAGTPAGAAAAAAIPADKPLRIVYFTDPICSTCWGIEPQWRRLKLEYGHVLDISYHMGGLLPSWKVYNSGGISGPADVAHHWEEVAVHYQMPIDGSVWLQDPPDSSFPPSRWFKAAQVQDTHKAVIFLRRLREMIFMEAINITRTEEVLKAAAYAELDTVQLEQDFAETAPALFEADLQLRKEMGVRGFPSVFFVNADGTSELVYGAKPYQVFITALHKLLPAAQPRAYAKDIALFSYFPTLTTKEYAVLNDMSFEAAYEALEAFREQGKVSVLEAGKGHLWRVTAD
ncbi:DsbA family protein [Chitinophaga solisilvae]|uniref:DsbA family protein n=1 Tax=Chitinophaga solisilvae TaxID=1233460 RepID=UPI00136E7E80|nr:DsbA family protein [Chitinophaga solisilvae]